MVLLLIEVELLKVIKLISLMELKLVNISAVEPQIIPSLKLFQLEVARTSGNRKVSYV